MTANINLPLDLQIGHRRRLTNSPGACTCYIRPPSVTLILHAARAHPLVFHLQINHSPPPISCSITLLVSPWLPPYDSSNSHPFSHRTANIVSLANDIDLLGLSSLAPAPHRRFTPRVFTSVRLHFQTRPTALVVAGASLCPFSL